MAARTIHLLTCVWGPWHIEMLRALTWPTALAPGNLPALARRHPVLYRICTTRADRATIEALPGFKAIAALVPVEFVTDLLGDAPDPMRHMQWYFTAWQEAAARGAVNFTLWPDVLLTENTFSHAADAFERGCAGAVIPMVRVVSETIVPDVAARLGSDGAPIALPSGDAVRLAVRHMHPLTAAAVSGVPHGKPGTSMYFRVPGEGLIIRGEKTWLYADPSRLGVLPAGDLAPIDPNAGTSIHVAKDSDDMLLLSLAPLWKEIETFLPGHRNDALDIARMCMLPVLASSPFTDDIATTSVRLHYGTMTEARWAAVERRAAHVLARALALRDYLKIWEALTAHGCGCAAQIMSLLVHATATARLLPRVTPYTVFVPADGALVAASHSVPERGRSWLDRLLGRDPPRPEPEPPLEPPFAGASARAVARWLGRPARKALLAAVRAHVVAGAVDLPRDRAVEVETLAGPSLTIRPDGAHHRIDGRVTVTATLAAGPHRVHVIDGCLALPGGTR